MIAATNCGNFVATLQLIAKSDPILKKQLTSAKRNAKYKSKTIQNQIVHIYASKMREKVTQSLREKICPTLLLLIRPQTASLTERF